MPPERRTLGRYELIEPIGAGTATEAFRAKSFGVEGFEKTLVVKRLLPELASLESFVQSFIEHVQRATRLSHANLAQVFDLGKDTVGPETAYFLATELVSGLDLEKLLARARAAGDAPSMSLALYVTLEVAKALDHAHRRRDEQLRPLAVVHGAVAPHNVIVSFDGDVKLTDFGIMRAMLAPTMLARAKIQTLGVVSPEQARGEEPTVQSDVFSLGAFLYGLLAGSDAFVGETAPETLLRVSRADPVPLESLRDDVPAPLSDLIHRALAREPEGRFRSISSLYEELLACTFACGLRASQSDLSAFVEKYRDLPRAEAPQVIDVLLSRPLTVPPPPLEVEPTGDSVVVHVTSVPPPIGFGEMRHVSALCLVTREPLPDSARERLRTTLLRYGGEIVTEESLETTALFGLDRSDGRDTESAVRCALVLARAMDIGDAAPAVGVDAGRIRLGRSQEPARDDRLNRLASSARSLANAADRGVGVARRAVPSLRGRFALEPLDQNFRATEFTQERFADAFVGRKMELAKLAETLIRASRGEFRILTIVGDAGIGKTRLAVEMQRRLARGPFELKTYFATCPPRGRELPFSGVTAMLRRVCGVRDGDPPERIVALEPRLRALGLDGDEVFAVQRELGAGAHGRVPAPNALPNAVIRMMHSLSNDAFTVFVWDDAHELDAATCDLLARAAPKLAQTRVAVVLSARPDPGAPFQSLPIHSELLLGEMDADDIERLVASRASVSVVPRDLFEFLRDRAGGQPMFVEELLRQLFDSGLFAVDDGRVRTLSLDEGITVPRTLRALTADRLRRLSEQERQVFVAAAILEPPVDSAVLATVVGLPLDAVESVAESLMAGGLLAREGPSAFVFPSPLAREVVLAELDAKDLAELHGRAAQAHRAMFGDDVEEQADQIGYHLAAAGDRDGAADLYARSGLYYAATRQLDRAALDLAYALELCDLETRSPEQIGNWLRALSASVRYVRTGPSLPPLIERLVQRVDAGGVEPSLRTAMRTDLACILGALDQHLAAEALLDGGASDARSEPALVARLLAARADLASIRGDFRLARRALDPLARMTVADPEEQHRVALSKARMLGAAREGALAERALEEAVAVAADDNPLLALDRAVVRVTLDGNAGKWREAAERAVQVAAHAEELGLLYEVASSLSEQAAALARLGERARARAAVASALAAAAEANAPRLVLRCRAILAALESSELGASAMSELRDHVAEAESHGWILDALLSRLLLGRVAKDLGSGAEARQELLLAARIASSTGNQAYSEECSAEAASIV